MKMNNVMIDLETMDNGTNAAIVAIGAVKFDMNGIGNIFYTAVSLESSVSMGLTMSASTVSWWLTQSKKARDAITDKNAITLNFALCDFNSFLSGNEDYKVWGNGADFDNVILANAYKACGFTTPWKFYNSRCYRTMKNLAPDIKMDRIGTHHNAIDDAVSQANHLIAVYKHLGLVL